MFHFDDDFTYRMPAHFGGVRGGDLHDLQYDDVTSIAISYLTDEERLAQYVPDAFEITEPVVIVEYQKCCGVHWMGGGQYTLLAVMTPVRHLDSGTDGAFALVVWENKTAPILGGREETGIPKVFADIPDYHALDGHIWAHASHEGRTFLEMELQLDRELTAEEIVARNADGRVDQMGWRHIPNIGRPGAAVSHATLYPVDVTYRSGSTGASRITWTKMDYLQNPAQFHIIAALADLPIVEYRTGVFAKMVTHLRGDLARELV
ncbi:MAG: acetoacetate decarboxylase family protein [Chloroflexota bacterium]